MADKKFVGISSTAGRVVFARGTKVYSHIGGNQYIRKNVEDVEEGEQILWRNDSIDAKLEDVEPHLRQSPRYKEAEDRLFVRVGSVKIPVLRVELVRGLATKLELESDDLERRVLKDGVDFSSGEYERMRTHLAESLSRIPVPERKESTYDSWLRGETIAPQDWIFFDALATLTGSSVFSEIYNPTQNPTFRDEYRLYVGIRTGIMSWLSRKSLKEVEEALNKDIEKIGLRDSIKNWVARRLGRSKLRLRTEEGLAQERKIVMSYFVGSVNSEVSNVRVLQVTQHDGRQGGQYHPTQAQLPRGAFTGPEVPEGELVDAGLAWNDIEFITVVLEDVILKYFSKTNYGTGMPWNRKSILDTHREMLEVNGIEDDLFKSVIIMYMYDKNLIKSPFKGVISDSASSNPDLVDLFDTLADRFYRNMVDGEVDKVVGVKTGSTYALFQATVNLMHAIPDVMKGRAIVSYSRRNEKSGRQKRRERRQLERRMGRNFGSGKVLLGGILYGPLDWMYDDEDPATVRGRLQDLPNREDVLEKLIGVKDRIFTRDEAVSTLAKYDAEDLVRALDSRNFYLDKAIFQN